jgi:TPP-dependent pyruvate/acetoin dehydrogenase alpha subunit
MAEWKKRDPLKRLADWLIRNKMATATQLEELQRADEQRIEKSFEQIDSAMK